MSDDFPASGERVIYFPAFVSQPPYPAKFVRVACARREVVTLELLGGSRDGEQVRAILHDATGRWANSWCRSSEYTPAGEPAP